MNEEEIDSSKELHVVKAGVGESTAPGSRIRKSTIQSDFVTNDAEALTTIREYNKQKKIQDALKKTKRKRQERELADAAVAKATVAELQKKPKVNKGSVQKPLNAKQREELEREESLLRIFNERLTHYTLYRTHKLREETWEAKSISDAIRSGIRQSNTLLLDWTHPEVNKIGSLCKVYWDGEKNWFYARILNYDRVHNRHLVYYELDHTAEWIVFENECAMLSEGLILQQYGSNVFPAIYFRSTAKGDEQNSKQKNYKKGAYYVEFLTPNGKNEWNFYYASQMYPIEDKYMPSRISTIFEMKLKLAQEEHEKTESVIKEVLASTAKSVFKVLRGPDWIGLRVRALAHRLVKHGESSEQTALDGVAKCEGTIVSYCGPSDEHFVVFDNPLLQSVWIRCEPSSIDALIGPTEVSCKRTQQLFHQRKYTPDVFVSNPICSMCGLGEVSQNGIEIDSKVSADMGNDTEIVDSVVEDGTEDSGNIALEMQRVSRMKRRDFSDTITANLPSSRTFNAKKSSAFSDSTTSTTLNTCKSCHTHYHSMCLPVYKLNWPLADIELVDGLCWACIRCRGGCDSTAFDTCLIPWSLRRAHEWAPDERKPTCGACMSKYLVEKEYCNVCYKTYPTELSMVPTLETLISPEAQFDDRGTSIDLKNQSSNAENDQLDTEEVNLEYIPYDSSSIPNSVRSPHIFIQYFTEDEFNAKSSIQKFPRPLQDQPSDVDGPKAAGKKGKGRKKRKVEGSSRNTAGESAEEENEKDEGDEEQNKGNGADDKEDDANEKTVVTTIDENNISTIDKVDKVDTSFTVKDVTDPLALPSIESGAIDVEEETANVMNVSTTSIELDNSRMIECNECKRWVHAQCEGLDAEQYHAISTNSHPVWGDEYLCPFCRIKVSLDVVDKLSTIDQRGLGIFAYPVTEAVAKNYFDVIRNPMDLQTMKENATRGTYKSMQSLRQDWELMSLNAILFNKSGDEYWLEAKRFYEYGLLYFDSLPRSSHHSAFGAEIRILIEKFYQANPNLRPVCQEKVKKRGRYTVEEPVPSLSSTVSQFETEKISQIPESEVAETFIPEPEIEFQIPLPTDLAIPLDPTSYIPCFASTMPMDHALIICQRDQCLMCGSTDSEEFMLICIDCGEVCHSFCAEAPLATMDALARRHWRCTNCKICEACGTASESDSCSLMYCDRCDRSYHNTCMIPQVPELEESESWICAACVSCTKCAGYTTNTHINADPSVANNEMNTDTINSDVVNISKVYTPVWGIKVDECIRCHREEVEKREKEEREISSKNMILYKEMIDHVENRSTRVCGVCALQCYTDSHVLCNECQQHFHLACMKNLCEPWIPNNRLNSDFICISCLSAHTAQKYSSTHMGIIANCLPVVIDAAKIQRRQTQCLIQNDAEVKVLATATYRAEAEKHRRVLKTIIIWASHRLSMGLLGQNENKIDISKIHNATHWLKARAARFLAKWRIMKSNSGPDRQRSGDKKSDMAIKKSLHYFQLGLDSSGNEFEINELVTLASLASAFIKTTDILLLEKSMEITLHGTEGRQIDLEADISVASKALLTLLFREDREAVLSHYGKLFHIEHKFQSITTKYTSRIEEKKRVALQEQGIVLETRDQIKEYFCDEEKMEMLRVIDFLIIKEILKEFMLALAVPPVFGNPRGMISRPNILSSEEGNHDALIALRSSFMSSTFSSSSSSSSSSFQVQSIISSKNISDEVISGTSSPIEQLKNASAKKPTYLLNRPKFDALFPKISNTKAVPIPLSSSIMTEQTKFSTYNDGSNNDDDDVSYHGPEKNNKTTKDRLITLDLNPYSHGSTSYIDDKNITRLKSQNPLLPGVEDEEYIRYKKTVSDWTLALNRSLRQSVKITYDAVVEAEYELIRFESTSGTELTSVSAPGAVSNDIKLLTIDIDSVGVTKPAAAEVATSLDVEEVIDMIDNEPSVALITIKEESIHPSPAPSPEPIVESVTIDSDSNSDKSPKPNPYHENVSSIPVPNSDQIPQSDLVGVTNATPIVSVDTGMQVDDKSATTPQDIKVAEDPFNASSISQHLLCAPCMPSTLRKKLRAPQTDANFAYPALYNGLSSTLRQDPNISALLAVESALRKCVFCHDGTVGDIVYGRIMTSLDGHFFHVNCLRFSHGVIENSNGVLEGSLAVLERVILANAGGRYARRPPCLYCKGKGATVSCAYNQTCSRFMHLKCALACQFTLMEVKSDDIEVSSRRDGKFDIQAIAVCPEHYPRFATNRITTKPRKLWRPCDPLRLLTTQAASEYIETREYISVQLKEREGDIAARSGALTILDIGHPKMNSVYFHTAETIFPHGYKSIRIYWSMKIPFQRTLYLFEILSESDMEGLGIDPSCLPDTSSPSEPCDRFSKQSYQKYAMFLPSSLLVESTASRDSAAQLLQRRVKQRHREKEGELENHEERPIFKLMFSDDPSRFLITKTIEAAYDTILNEVEKCHDSHSSEVMKRRDRISYGITPCQFFGLTVPFVQQAIESKPESLMAVTFIPPAPQYKPCFRLPIFAEVARMQNLAKAMKGFQKVSINGSARADAYETDVLPGRRQAFTRILAKTSTGENDTNGAVDDDGNLIRDNLEEPDYMFDESDSLAMERLKAKYRELSEGYLIDPYARLLVRRSHIHGWGLFARCHFAKDDMIIEYIGEKVRQVVADRRESQYEQEGVGSCYLFRLDKEDIVDATRTGGMARFINHCCEPNAYARVITTDGNQKHIIIFAGKSIQLGEEVTYDYKFPIEEKKLKCYCGAPKCSGSMN